MKKLIALLLLVVSTVSYASPIKFGHMGIVAHENILRVLTDGQDAMIVGFPGGKGVVGFNALASGDVDFMLVTGSSLFISPLLHKDIYRFDPMKRFKVISVVSRAKPVLVFAKQYHSVDDVVSAKCAKGEPVFAAPTTEKAQLQIELAFAGRGCKLIHVTYSGKQGAALIDVAAGRIDVAQALSSSAAPLADRTNSIFLSSVVGDSFLKEATVGAYLVTRHDVPEERIAKVLAIFSTASNSERAKVFQKTSALEFLNKTGPEVQEILLKNASKYSAMIAAGQGNL